MQITKESELDLTGTCVVKFSATWCMPCKKLDPILTKMEKEFPDVKFYSVDIDDLTKLAKKYKILSVPSLLFFDGEKEVNRIVGLQPTELIRKAFKSL